LVEEKGMTKKEFLNHLEEIIEADPDTLSGNEELKELKKWDSLAIVGFIAMVDEKFGITLAGKTIQACKSVEDLMSLVGPGKISQELASS
jgi:acyl carrier protein